MIPSRKCDHCYPNCINCVNCMNCIIQHIVLHIARHRKQCKGWYRVFRTCYLAKEHFQRISASQLKVHGSGRVLEPCNHQHAVYPGIEFQDSPRPPSNPHRCTSPNRASFARRANSRRIRCQGRAHPTEPSILRSCQKNRQWDLFTTR